VALGIFGSLDVNRGDRQSGWDTDQFPNDPTSMALGFYHLFRAGGFTTGGCNFDAKIRRQSLDPDDLLLAHIGGMDVCARALLMAAEMIEDGVLPRLVADRYAGWKTPENQAILKGERSLGDLAALVAEKGINPSPRSGRQEYLENLVNRYL
jgi:xylose isomerase